MALHAFIRINQSELRELLMKRAGISPDQLVHGDRTETGAKLLVQRDLWLQEQGFVYEGRRPKETFMATPVLDGTHDIIFRQFDEREMKI